MMSGYDAQRNIFELTGTKLRRWFRRREFPPEFYCECCGLIKYGYWELAKSCLEYDGLTILKDGGNYLHIRGTPAQIWEALSGQPSDPEREKYYYIRTADLSEYD